MTAPDARAEPVAVRQDPSQTGRPCVIRVARLLRQPRRARARPCRAAWIATRREARLGTRSAAPPLRACRSRVRNHLPSNPHRRLLPPRRTCHPLRVTAPRQRFRVAAAAVNSEGGRLLYPSPRPQHRSYPSRASCCAATSRLPQSTGARCVASAAASFSGSPPYPSPACLRPPAVSEAGVVPRCWTLQYLSSISGTWCRAPGCLPPHLMRTAPTFG
jgi:hypothetical protein